MMKKKKLWSYELKMVMSLVIPYRGLGRTIYSKSVRMKCKGIERWSGQ